MSAQERQLLCRRLAEQGQDLVEAAGPIDLPALQVARRERAERVGAGDIGGQQAPVVLRLRLLVAGTLAVERGERFTRRHLRVIEGDDLFEGGDRRVRLAASRQLAVPLPEPRPACARGGLIGGRRQRREHAGEPLGERGCRCGRQSIGQVAERDQRRLVLRVLVKRPLQHRGRFTHLTLFGHEQRRLAPPLGPFLRILDQIDEQGRCPGRGVGVPGGAL